MINVIENDILLNEIKEIIHWNSIFIQIKHKKNLGMLRQDFLHSPIASVYFHKYLLNATTTRFENTRACISRYRLSMDM